MALENAIASHFSRAASQYSQHNRVQNICQQQLLARLTSGANLLDVGAGPGTDFSKNVNCGTLVLAVDIASGMLTQLSTSFPTYVAMQADAQDLPIATASIDRIYSNLALQWCDDFSRAAAELTRVCQGQGELLLSIVTAGSLPELLTLQLKVNPFRSSDYIYSVFDDADWQTLSAEVHTIKVHFDNLRTLLYSIKGVGANTSLVTDTDASRGLLSRRYWMDLLEVAETLREPQGIPLTYKVTFLHMRRLP
ncbi:methyltransferase domain-containing protein [Shewanella sp. NIFS-20-20]|uniref:methyltransferase domain-containing protein n=1 Tax=Shewanella sp. NIFS-20-20 TaxID=2853806 RepID=UPI001C49018B|nr:methyltransferase domain-containing protein [Shewanella sp. NIFS-20-20]MBV7317207.1 methyltransferase domain-containing protein [Shewanella sp. NIFS-20-20]